MLNNLVVTLFFEVRVLGGVGPAYIRVTLKSVSLENGMIFGTLFESTKLSMFSFLKGLHN